MHDSQLIELEHFSNVSLDDAFFDSLKSDYPLFEQWYKKKSAEAHNYAYIFRNPRTRCLDGFLYLKTEDGAVGDVSPPLSPSYRLKIGTFKINPHGTRLGERFLKRAFDTAISSGVSALYVTVFSKHVALVNLFRKYGFQQVAEKNGTNDNELVLERRLDTYVNDVALDYPRFPIKNGRHFILSLYPEWQYEMSSIFYRKPRIIQSYVRE